MDRPCRQCRGEWKLARVVPVGDVYVAASPPGIDRVSTVHVFRATFQSPLQLRGGLRGDFQCIINGCPYRQCRGEWKLARVAVTGASICGGIPSGNRPRFRVACIAGDLPVAPTATRWRVWVICNALSMTVHAGSVGASGSSPGFISDT